MSKKCPFCLEFVSPVKYQDHLKDCAEDYPEKAEEVNKLVAQLTEDIRPNV